MDGIDYTMGSAVQHTSEHSPKSSRPFPPGKVVSMDSSDSSGYC